MQPQIEQANAATPPRRTLLRSFLTRGGPAWLPYAFYAALALALTAPFMGPGYILTLDSPLGPGESLNDGAYVINEWWLSPSVHLAYLAQLARAVVPLWLMQKVGFFLVFFLGGLGAHRLARKAGMGAYFAGLLYVLNPFVYVRFLAGQWWLLASYAVMPFAAQAFLDLLALAPRETPEPIARTLRAAQRPPRVLGLAAPTLSAGLRVAALTTLTGLVYVHGFVLLLLAYFVFLAVYLARAADRGTFLRWTLRYLGPMALLTLSLNIFWLVPALTNSESILSGTSQLDLSFFAPRSTSNLGVAFETASMYGFWREGYVYPKDGLPVLWALLFAFILFLAVLGALAHWGETDAPTGPRGERVPRESGLAPQVVGFSIVGGLGLLLAIGVSSPATAPLFERLGDAIPAARGFRDSHKFVALLCLSYAFLGALGVAELRRALDERLQSAGRIAVRLVLVAALLTPVVYSYGMFGFLGQIGTADVPRSWREVDEELRNDPDDVWMLVLPWHLYMDYSWLPNRDKRLASPAHLFFSKPVYAGDNIEAGGIHSQSTSPSSRFIEALIRDGANQQDIGNLLAPLNVRYVLLLREVNYADYEFLRRQPDLKVALERDDLTLFRNTAGVGRAFAVQQAPPPTPQAGQPPQAPTPLAAALSATGRTTLEPLAVQPDGPWRWRVKGTSRPYITFPVPPKAGFTSWTFNGEPPLSQAGYLPIWRFRPDGGVVVYERFYRVLLPSYIASGMALALAITLGVAAARAEAAPRRRKAYTVR
ncbi:MAG: hypothetical protein Q7T26_13185 [Dehalococcoidia bacterium]|nr:hypothetical protein [Dehalococcoidia bacterium]